ncbi:plastocyanin/azurin family copper-binding protein [Methylophaga sp. OBS4]|uniref:plastocyanin/azurin family copper-binding protein n=1 Tax=Methylophaga sp. OBS4 TaxID=2991935 RepID=UPI0022588A8C|nr:plastocyanin/azurin family copper-binding protein [Methylophaga sp. OBS4]MCX4186561.1 plastocyanin/azurin family copper-binding protein [Methylophaga sp. OBS4]
MYKKKAVMITVIIAALAVLVLVAVSTVFIDDSKERYQNVPAPEEIQNQDDSADAPATVEPEVTEPPAQSETESETVAEETGESGESKEEASVAPDQAEEETQSAGEAQVHIVTAQGLVYNPLVVVIQPGDTVAWENMPTHDTQSMEGLIPEGAEAWHSALGENYQRTFTQEGIYVYKCTPHFGAGMGGAIIVGKPVNLEAIKASGAKGAAGRLVRKAIQAAEAL